MTTKYTDDTKAAVMAALLAGQSVSKVSEEFDIPRSTVGNWSAKLNRGEPVLSADSSRYYDADDKALYIAIGMDVGRLSLNDLSIKYKVHRSTIHDWIKNARIVSSDKTTGSLNDWELPRKKDSGKTRYVYFVRESFSGLVKIGVAKNIESRLSSMQTSCPQNIDLVAYIQTDVASQIEKLLHHKFASKHYRGEWYSLSNDDVDRCVEFLGGYGLFNFVLLDSVRNEQKKL